MKTAKAVTDLDQTLKVNQQYLKPAIILWAIICSFASVSQAQIYKEYPYPLNEFGNPLGIDWKLSGSFGEPRGNHFHAGTDVKTNGATGYKLYAVEEGYVARVKVSPYGYGKALYIAHPNGYTSVYAHMSGFNEVIDSLVKYYQYATESFAQDIYLDASALPVKKGEVIGLSGNSGGSAGPHLHFEIRETSTQQALNPLFFGYAVYDNKPPTIKGVKLTTIPEGSSYYDVSGRRFDVVQENGIHKVKDTIYLEAGKVALGVHGYDQQTLTTNKNGIFRIDMMVNNEHCFTWTMDKMRFDQGRYVNAFRDFYERKQNRTVYNCFRLPGNHLELYEFLINDGFINVAEGAVAKIDVEVWDFHKNKSTIQLYVGGKSPKQLAPSENDKVLVRYNQNASVERNHFSAYFSNGTFYDDVNIIYEEKASPSKSIYSNIHQLHNKLVPLHKSAAIQVQPIGIPNELKNKAVMMHKDLKGVEQALNTFWKGERVAAKCKEVGSFYVKLDTIAPKVNTVNFNTKTKSFRGNQIRLKISDNLSGIKSYNGYIDGKWVLFDYDAKRNALTYKFDEKCPSGEHKLKAIVTDGVGNTSEKIIEFKR